MRVNLGLYRPGSRDGGDGRIKLGGLQSRGRIATDGWNGQLRVRARHADLGLIRSKAKRQKRRVVQRERALWRGPRLAPSGRGEGRRVLQ